MSKWINSRLLFSTLLLLSLLLFVINMGGCSFLFTERHQNRIKINGRLTLPVGTSEVVVLTPFDTDIPNKTGEFTVEGFNSPLQFIVLEKNNTLLTFATVINNATDSSNQILETSIDPASVALSLIFLNPIFIGTSMKQRQMLIKDALNHPNFSLLCNLIEHTLAQGIPIFSDETDNRIFIIASEIAREIYEANKEKSQIYEKSTRLPQIYGEASPQIEDISPTQAAVINYSEVYYCVGIYDHDAKKFLDGFIVPRRKRNFYLFLEPPQKQIFEISSHERKDLYISTGRPGTNYSEVPDIIASAVNTGKIIMDILNLVLPTRVIGLACEAPEHLNSFINSSLGLNDVVYIDFTGLPLCGPYHFLKLMLRMQYGAMLENTKYVRISKDTINTLWDEAFGGNLLEIGTKNLIKNAVDYLYKYPESVYLYLKKDAKVMIVESNLQRWLGYAREAVSKILKIADIALTLNFLISWISSISPVRYELQREDFLTYIPKISFDSSPQGSVYVGEPIAFYASAYDYDGKIERFLWDLDGDGSWDQETKSECCDVYDGHLLYKGHLDYVFHSPGTKKVTCKAVDDAGAWETRTIEIEVKDKKPKLNVSVSPNPVMISPGGYHQVIYTFREEGNCAVSLSERTGQFYTPSGEPITEESNRMSQNIFIPANGFTTWEDNIYLPADVASKAIQKGFDRVIHRARFYGQDCTGRNFSVTVDLGIIIKQGCPDLEMESIWIEPASFRPGQRVTIHFKGKNIGTADAGEFQVALLFDGKVVGTATKSGLVAGEEVIGIADLTWPSDTECHMVGVVLDSSNAIVECREDNNSLTKEFCPSISSSGCPDLAMEDIWIDPATFSPGQRVTVWLRFKNIGSADAGAFKISLLLDGEEIDSGTVNGLPAGKELKAYKDDLIWPDAKCHTIEAVLDPTDMVSECREDNNTLAKQFCPQSTQLPDLIISSLEVSYGQPLPPYPYPIEFAPQVSVTVKNIGNRPTNGPFKVALLRMALPPDGDWELFKEETVEGLGPGESYSFTCSFEYPPEGCEGWIVQAIADPDNVIEESNEDNNSYIVEAPLSGSSQSSIIVLHLFGRKRSILQKS